MYGLLRPSSKYLSAEAKKLYAHIYCGQCVALQDHFGYAARMTTSYDAAFIGLLIAAQQDDAPLLDRRYCALFPKKKSVCVPSEPSTRIAAAIAVSFRAMKIKDEIHDRKSLSAIMQNKLLGKVGEQATDILVSYGISSSLINTTLEDQQYIEQKKAQNLLDYARPTARFLSEMLRATSAIARRPENGDVLAHIGTALGRIIYLVDACADLADDIQKKEFNALLTVFLQGQELQHDASDRVSRLIINNLTEIKVLLAKLELIRYREIVEGVLLTGLPLAIKREISRSQDKLIKFYPSLSKYAPHAALTSALCLFIPDTALAGGVWGEKTDCGTAYGYSCCDDCGCCCINDCCKKDGNNCHISIESWVNPCLYTIGTGKEFEGGPIAMCIQYALQLPKFLFTVVFPFIFIHGKYAGWKSKAKEKSNEIRKQRNSSYVSSEIEKINKIQSNIQNKLSLMCGTSANIVTKFTMFSDLFNTMITNEAAKKADIAYSKSREITDGAKRIIEKAKDMERKLQNACALQQRLRQAIASARQLNVSKDPKVEYKLKFYEELTGHSELNNLLFNHRFDDYQATVELIMGELSSLGKQVTGCTHTAKAETE